ncbi:pentapeptide repeat-containing protein, partial [bacterium]|nr:pentapeptide repeat-containing protein [bacterium]
HLQGACLVGAHLQGAYLCEAHLQGADIHRAHLQGACFVGAYLQGAKLRYTDLQGTDLYDAQLQGADLTRAQLQGADLSHAQLCADPGYRPGEEWDEWIKDSENNEWAKDRLLEGKQRLTGGLDAASLTKADLGAGQCKGKTRIKLTAIDNKYREETYQRIVKNVSSWGIVTLVYNDNNKEIEAVELELAPAVLEETDLRGVDLSKSTIAGADFTSARLDGTLLRGTQFGIKKPNKEGVLEYDSHWHHKDRRGYSDKIKRNRVKLFNKYRRLKPKWLRSLLKPLIKRRVKSTMIRAELPIFEEANLEAADWADNRRAQRDFIYAEYVRQFKHRHPRIAKLWSITCDYGRTLKRWAAWSAAFMILFGALFLASHLLHKADDNWFTRNVLPQVELQHELQKGQPTEFSYFYFSAVTFTTLGFGDVTP